jgi:hypothetical protein
MSIVPWLDSRLKPLSRCLDAESAQRVIELRFDSALQELPDVIQRLRHTNFRVSERLLQAFLEEDAARRRFDRRHT